DAVALARLADERGRVLMVGHTFEYVPAVRVMKEIIDSGDIGDVLYLHAQRLNLGRIQSDINAFWWIGRMTCRSRTSCWATRPSGRPRGGRGTCTRASRT